MQLCSGVVCTVVHALISSDGAVNARARGERGEDDTTKSHTVGPFLDSWAVFQDMQLYSGVVCTVVHALISSDGAANACVRGDRGEVDTTKSHTVVSFLACWAVF